MEKNFKYGLKLWSVNIDLYKTEIERLYKEGLYEFIELYAVPGTTNTIKSWEKLDIPYIIHAPHYAHGMNLANPDKLDSNIKLYEETKLFADELKAEYIVFHPGVGGEITETIRQFKLINDERILIENKPYKGLPQMEANFCTGSRIKEIKTFIEATGAGFCFDIGHAVAAAKTFNTDFMQLIRDFIELAPVLYHLSDTDINAETDYHYNFGKGNLDTKKILELLPDNAVITVETDKASKDNLNDFREDIEYLNNILYKYSVN